MLDFDSHMVACDVKHYANCNARSLEIIFNCNTHDNNLIHVLCAYVLACTSWSGAMPGAKAIWRSLIMLANASGQGVCAGFHC